MWELPTRIRPWNVHKAGRRALAARIENFGLRGLRFWFRGSHNKIVKGDEAVIRGLETHLAGLNSIDLQRTILVRTHSCEGESAAVEWCEDCLETAIVSSVKMANDKFRRVVRCCDDFAVKAIAGRVLIRERYWLVYQTLRRALTS